MSLPATSSITYNQRLILCASFRFRKCAAIETPSTNVRFSLPRQKNITFNCTLITSSNYIWILLRRMAYRGQGQKVQKVMVQPIVSFQTAELHRLLSFVLIYFDFIILIILYWIKYYITIYGFKNAEYLINVWDVCISFVLVPLIGYKWMKNAFKMIRFIFWMTVYCYYVYICLFP